MPAPSSSAGARWGNRKRDPAAGAKSKLKEHDNGDSFGDDDDEDDPDLDHPKPEDDPPNHRVTGEKEGEKLFDGGLRISNFSVAIRRELSRPHSSVFQIVESERAARNADSRGRGGAVAALENISYGQLQVAASGSDVGSCVIKPLRIFAGSGVTKRLGSAGRVHVVPVHSDWFSLNSVHRLERQVVPHFFTGKPGEHAPAKYMECRNFIVAKYMENPDRHLSVVDCQRLVAGIDNDDLNRIMRFLDSWGIINYCATPLKHEVQKEGTYLYEDSNSELCVHLAALKSIDSLIKFDKPICKLKATHVYPELKCQRDEDFDIDSTIRAQLSDNRCYCCLQSIPAVYYQSQKEVGVRLCLDCFNEGRFVGGHSSLDYVKENSMKDYGDVDGDSWSDQETLLLLEGMQLYNENWNKIAEHVGSKSILQCIVHFVRLPLDGVPLENIDVPSTSGSSKFWSRDDPERSEPKPNGWCLQGNDTENKFIFSDSENPVMSLVAFLASALGPRVAAACAHASLSSLSKDSKRGPLSLQDSLSIEKVRVAAKDGLTAAALKSKLFADHEEREIQRLSANIVNQQIKRLELKLKQFAEVETLLTSECEQMEGARQRIGAERAFIMSPHVGSPGVARATSLPVTTSTVNNYSNTLGSNGREQVLGSQQPHFVPGYGSNQQQIHQQMSMMQHQQQGLYGSNQWQIDHQMSMMQQVQQKHQHQQQGVYGLGPRMLPLSAIHPPSSTPNAMFGSPSNSQQSIGHPMLRPFSGTRPSLG